MARLALLFNIIDEANRIHARRQKRKKISYNIPGMDVGDEEFVLMLEERTLLTKSLTEVSYNVYSFGCLDM